MTDLFRIASGFQSDSSPVRVRFGTVSSVEADRTCTVSVGGGTVSGVKYAASMAPCPGNVAFLLTDGVDLFAVDHLAAADLTLAPRAYRSASLTVANTTDTAVEWAAANSDAYGCWVSASPTRLTAPLSGRFSAAAYVEFAGDADGFRQAWVRKNGAEVLGYVKMLSAASGSPTNMTVSTPAFDLTKGDYVELVVRHNAGNDLVLNREGTLTPALSLIYLGP
jgi:hypothetical protein